MKAEFTKTKRRKYFYTADKVRMTERSDSCCNKENWFEAATESQTRGNITLCILRYKRDGWDEKNGDGRREASRNPELNF